MEQTERARGGTQDMSANLPSGNRGGYRDFKRGRPLWGGVAVVCGSFVTGVVPIQQLLRGGDAFLLWVGLGAAALLFVSGLLALAVPRRSTAAGVLALLFALSSLPGAFGGYLVGFGLAATGALVCIKWRPDGDLPRIEIAGDESSRGVTALSLVFVVGIAYFGAPISIPLVTGSMTAASSAGNSFPRSAGNADVGSGFIVRNDGIQGDDYDHNGSGYRETFTTSDNEDVPVGEFRLNSVAFETVSGTANAPEAPGFLLYKNFGNDGGNGSSFLIAARNGSVMTNDSTGVGGPDNEDYVVFASELWTGRLDFQLSDDSPLNRSSETVEVWTCNTNDPPDRNGSISDEREVDLMTNQQEVEIDPTVDSTVVDEGGLALNAHRLEGQQVVLEGFRLQVTDSQRNLSFVQGNPPQGC